MHTPRSLLVLLALGTLAGCGEPEDRVSDIHTLRILAIRGETPFAEPDTSVSLEMLAVDGSPKAKSSTGEARPVTMLWIDNCENPDGDSYEACLPNLHRTLKRLGDESLSRGEVPDGEDLPEVSFGSSHTVQVPADIISSRKVAEGVVHPYGIKIVFGVVCAGELRRLDVKTTEFPLGCFDPDTGAERGRDDFDIGFFPLFVYQGVANANPTLKATQFDVGETGASCSDESPCPKSSHCGSEGRCIPAVPRCTEKDEDDCPSYELSVDVPHSAAERAVVAHVSAADAPTESVWVSYYSRGGSWDKDARIISDPNSGWGDDTQGKWRATTEENTEVRLWAIVRDNRSGVSWAYQDVWVTK